MQASVSQNTLQMRLLLPSKKWSNALTDSKAKELDDKHNLVQRGKAAIAQSTGKIDTAIRDPLSLAAKRITGAAVTSFLLGLRVGGGVRLGVDFQQGLAGDVAHAIEDLVLLVWKRMKEVGWQAMLWLVEPFACCKTLDHRCNDYADRWR